MTELRDIEYRPVAVTSTILLWVMFIVVVVGTAVLVFGLPGGQALSARRIAAAGAFGTSTEGEATFSQAAELLRDGRHAEAFGRFVALADSGDVNAARIALHMYRFGPTIYKSQWDASAEQVWTWTRSSQKAENLELANLTCVGRPAPELPDARRN